MLFEVEASSVRWERGGARGNVRLSALLDVVAVTANEPRVPGYGLVEGWCKERWICDVRALEAGVSVERSWSDKKYVPVGCFHDKTRSLFVMSIPTNEQVNIRLDWCVARLEPNLGIG